jgi:hypothetical protein
MNRLAGIVSAVVGLIIIGLVAAKVLPSMTGTGVLLILVGGLAIGLSFVRGPEDDGTPRMSTAATIGNIFVSPSEVFQNLRRHPRWLAVIILTAIFSSTYSVLFMQRLTAERVVNFMTDKTLQLSMVANNPEAVKNVEGQRPQAIADAKNPILQAASYVNDFSVKILFTAFLAGLFLLFALAMGGKINFWQAFSATAYAFFPVVAIRNILGAIVLFLKDPVDIHPVLGQQGGILQDSLSFLVVPGEHPVLYVLLGSFSLLAFYWLFLNSSGLKNAGERVSSTTAWTATLVVWFVGIILMAGWVALFPGFMS